MKMEDHFKETLARAVADEPPVVDAWSRFEQRAVRGRRVHVAAAIAAATAVAVVSVILVPRLGPGGRIGLATEPPSPGPTSSRTVDPYAGWRTYEYARYDFKLRYPENWTIKIFEANPEVLAPGQKPIAAQWDSFTMNAAAERTMAVTVTLLDGKLFDPKWREFGLTPGTRPDGRPFLRHVAEPLDSGGRRISYSIDWSTCFGSTGTPSCVRRARMLFVAIHIGTKALGDAYAETGEKIVTSIEYFRPAG